MITILVLLLVIFISSSVLANPVDEHENCEFWASVGECEANPGYMLTSCALSCSKLTSDSVQEVDSFYNIVEKDINGLPIDFNIFRDKVVYIVNVASHCGYTAENYELLKRLKQYRSHGLEIVIAPCNQFGQQEPGTSEEIVEFTKQWEFEGIILSKEPVNGPETRSSFSYLKSVSGKKNINWNFDGKFIIDRQGNYREIVNGDVEGTIVSLLDTEEF